MTFNNHAKFQNMQVCESPTQISPHYMAKWPTLYSLALLTVLGTTALQDLFPTLIIV